MPEIMSLRDRIASEILEVFTETFENVRGMYLDRGTSLFETLDTISAEVASRPVSADCGTIAAQVEHIRFYIDVLEGHMINQPLENVDWGEIWRNVSAVTPEEWEASKRRLKASYERVVALLRSLDTWEGENDVAGALEILVHTAFHLGQIRQALCTVKA
jgi:hypothetical protein